MNFIPIMHWLPKYSSSNLILDFIGGLTIGIMHVPQGIAYASLAQVPAVMGLYTSFFPPLFYAIFGTARQNSLGTFAVVSLMAGAVASRKVDLWNQIHKTSFNSSDIMMVMNSTSVTTVDVNVILVFTIGIVHIIMGLLRLSFVATYFSDQVVAGFTTAASMHVLVAQMKYIFNLPNLPMRSGPGELFLKCYDILNHIMSSNPYSIGISLISIAFLLLSKLLLAPFIRKKFKITIPIPFELLLIIIVTFFSTFFQLEKDFKMRVVGEIPTGLPKPRLPRFEMIPQIMGEAIGIAAVTFAVHISLAKICAKKLKYDIDVDQELFAIGLASIFSSFFSVFPVACSLGRTMVNISVGTKTQVFLYF
ncbi:unnamed protein product [Thelazia callipaeda]|uniref:Sulfate_transp domain-containing protein n=1 Tax=Thelazia callipaeda TaxID=103827 RepID=A0A0N5CRK2_THECL|nr:unnamed protein product [Thelazia callipaeda]